MSEVDPNGIAQHTKGAKLDAGKVDMSLLTLWPNALLEVCRVGTLGASKYSRGGFLEVANGYIRYTAAMLRHLLKESSGEVYDTDAFYDTAAGAPWKNTIRHDAQVAWNALSRLELKLKEEEQNAKARRTGYVSAAGQVTPIPTSYIDPFGFGQPGGSGVAGQAASFPESNKLGGLDCHGPTEG